MVQDPCHSENKPSGFSRAQAHEFLVFCLLYIILFSTWAYIGSVYFAFILIGHASWASHAGVSVIIYYGSYFKVAINGLLRSIVNEMVINRKCGRIWMTDIVIYRIVCTRTLAISKNEKSVYILPGVQCSFYFPFLFHIVNYNNKHFRYWIHLSLLQYQQFIIWGVRTPDINCQISFFWSPSNVFHNEFRFA